MSFQLRSDLQFNRSEVGNDGLWIYQIYDPVNEKYYRVNQQAFEIINFIANSTGIVDLNNLPGTRDEITKVMTFLKQNNLLFGEPGEQVSHKGFNVLIRAWIYFKIPIWRPDSFLSGTRLIGLVLFNRFTVTILTLFAMLGFILLYKIHDNFFEGVVSSLNPTALKYFIPTVIIIKIFHELSHAYTAKVLDCKVRAIGIAFIFMTPRFYTDVSDIVNLRRESRIKIALAGIWSELIIAGIACFFFISAPLHSIISKISISVITVSLASSILFNGNPLMRFDGYYVLKEILKIDNLYSSSMLAVRCFWRKLFFGLRNNDVLLTPILLIYGQLSYFYRIFLYSVIVTLVYHFFIPAFGVVLALTGIYIFFIYPAFTEIIYLIKNRQLISIYYKLFIFSLICAVTYVFTMEITIPESSPAIYSSEKTAIRAEIEGTIKDITNEKIIINNPELNYKIQTLDSDLKIVSLRKRQALAMSNYSVLKVLEALENRVKLALLQEQKKLSKLEIPLVRKTYFFNKREDLAGQFVKPGTELAYKAEKKYLYVYFGPDCGEVVYDGKVYFKNNFEGLTCKVVPGTHRNVRYIPKILSTLNGGPIETLNDYQPVKPLSRVQFEIEGGTIDYEFTCNFVGYRKIRLLTEIKNIFSKFIHDDY